MKKVLIFFGIVLLSCLTGALYGVLHDQFTYSIAPEYYTKFKFIQFGLVDWFPVDDPAQVRWAVAIVGALATWWFGLICGIVLGLMGFFHKDWRSMLRVTMKAFGLVILVAIVVGLIGLLIGWFLFRGTDGENIVHFNFPKNLDHFTQYMMVGSMHNASYIGGALGLIVGLVYSWKGR